MELTKFISKTINDCVQKNLKKTETKKDISDFLDSYKIQYTWNKYQLLIDDFGFEISFNSKGICRGHSVSHFKKQ